MFFNQLFLVFALPGLLLAMWAQFKVRNTFNTTGRVPSGRQLNGIETAKILMRNNRLTNIGIQGIPGQLTDHYHPRNKTINLSESSAQNSVASVAVVAHELGHAQQDAENYGPLKL